MRASDMLNLVPGGWGIWSGSYRIQCFIDLQLWIHASSRRPTEFKYRLEFPRSVEGIKVFTILLSIFAHILKHVHVLLHTCMLPPTHTWARTHMPHGCPVVYFAIGAGVARRYFIPPEAQMLDSLLTFLSSPLQAQTIDYPVRKLLHPLPIVTSHQS